MNSRRRLSAALAAAAIVSLGLAGCAGSTQAETSGARHLQIPVLASTAFVQNFNPFSPGAVIATKGTIYEPLFVVNKSKAGEETPWLATAYSWSDDLLTLTFTLQEGVKWSDGESFTADDVVFTYEQGRENPALDLAGFWTSMDGKSVTKTDDNTVAFQFGTPDATRFTQFANTSYILPEHIWSAQSDPVNWTNPEPVGTGPFTQVESFAAQSYTLTANPVYWRDDVAIPGIDYTQYASQDAVVQALKSDKADWGGVVIPDIEKTYVSADPEHNKFNYSANTSSLMLCVNSTVKPLDDPAFRKALSMSINRDAIQNNAVYGYAIPSSATGIGAQFPDLDITAKDPSLNDVVTYDIDAAKAMLADAGYETVDGKLMDKSGQPISLKLPVTSSWFDWVSTAQIISDGFTELGIDAAPDPLPDFAGWFDRLQKGDFAVSECGGGLFDSPSAYYYTMFASSLQAPIGEPAQQNAFGRWSSPEMDAVFDELRTTSDPQAKADLETEAQEIFVDNLPNIPLNSAPYWQAFTTHNYTGWPDADDNYSIGIANDYNQLLLFTSLKPVE
ncbi:ABC transporter substrate-binding protein [Microbacterium sp.]|uniref:ABC transporter substrate-binding protein n=1 Tax=Microbacterium sp. TaxID=51671 RepID=UPI003F72B088